MDVKNFEFTKDAIGFSAPASSKGKLTSNPEKIYVGKSTKIAGRLVYIRTKDGFKKMFEANVPSKYKYFEITALKPVTTGTSSSFSGSDVANDNLLDDNYSNIRGEKPFVYPRLRGAVAMDLSGNSFRFMRPQFTRPNNFNDYFDGTKSEEQSNAIGDWFKETFGKNSDSAAVEEKVVYTEEEANQLYKKSGAKTPFKDWISSDSSKQFLASLANFGSTLLLANAYNNQNQSGTNQGAASTTNNTRTDSSEKEPDEKTILGMHPVTFSLVGIGVLIGGYFGIKAIIKYTNK